MALRQNSPREIIHGYVCSKSTENRPKMYRI